MYKPGDVVYCRAVVDNDYSDKGLPVLVTFDRINKEYEDGYQGHVEAELLTPGHAVRIKRTKFLRTKIFYYRMKAKLLRKLAAHYQRQYESTVKNST